MIFPGWSYPKVEDLEVSTVLKIGNIQCQLHGAGVRIIFILGIPAIKCKGGAVKGAFRAANSMDNRRLAAEATDADDGIYNSKRRK